MECFWSLHRNRRQAGDRDQQDPPVFYLYFDTNDGFTSYYLPGTGFLAEYEKIYLGGKKKSLVLFIKTNDRYQ